MSDNILSRAIAQVGLRFDALSRQQKTLAGKVVYEDYLDWDTPTIGLSFEEIIGKYNVTVAAPTIGGNSRVPIVGSDGFETLRNTVLRHAIRRNINGSEFRRLLQILNAGAMLADDEKKKQLTDLIWGNVTEAVAGVQSKLDIIFLNALFNEGVCTLDSTNNPEGGARATIDYNQPAGNIAAVSTAWTSMNGGTVDCFSDIMAVIDAAQDKVEFAKILLAPSLLSYICRASSTRKLVWGTDRGTRPVQLADINAYMQASGLPVFVPVRRKAVVQTAGGVKTPYSPVNAGNLVFVPEGKLGVIKNAYAESELAGMEKPNVQYSNYGRIRVSQWTDGDASALTSQNIMAEANALPVITEMNGIYTLKTTTTTPGKTQQA